MPGNNRGSALQLPWSAAHRKPSEVADQRALDRSPDLVTAFMANLGHLLEQQGGVRSRRETLRQAISARPGPLLFSQHSRRRVRVVVARRAPDRWVACHLRQFCSDLRRAPAVAGLQRAADARWRWCESHVDEALEVLDLGCGTGPVWASLWRNAKRYLVGLDLSGKMLRASPRARQFTTSCTWRRGARGCAVPPRHVSTWWIAADVSSTSARLRILFHETARNLRPAAGFAVLDRECEAADYTLRCRQWPLCAVRGIHQAPCGISRVSRVVAADPAVIRDGARAIRSPGRLLPAAKTVIASAVISRSQAVRAK